MTIPALLVMVIFIEIAEHYFRWRELLMGRDLPRVVAYTLGVAGMMIPFTFWLIQEGYREAAWVLWFVIVSAGGAVGLAYLVDWIVNLVWTKREAGQREKAALTGIKEIIDGKSKPAND